jgi:hypothetical protein
MPCVVSLERFYYVTIICDKFVTIPFIKDVEKCTWKMHKTLMLK